MKVLPHTRSCFVCGESNPVGLKLLFHTDGDRVHAHFTPRPEHIGFKGVVHGGLLSTVLDEIMVWACVVKTKRFAFCAELTVHFSKPAVPNEEIIASAELVENRRNRIFEAKAELKNAAGETLATASGKYMPVPESDLTGMAADFVDDPSWVFEQR
ncbi:MAG TPA: PaaI family thioesterase [Verrucomicrobiota bacterium]|nr:PaaI family thioesterase [Verrucomicrobiota bacterium]